jgi:hypothetical protein
MGAACGFIESKMGWQVRRSYASFPNRDATGLRGTSLSCRLYTERLLRTYRDFRLRHTPSAVMFLPLTWTWRCARCCDKDPSRVRSHGVLKLVLMASSMCEVLASPSPCILLASNTYRRSLMRVSLVETDRDGRFAVKRVCALTWRRASRRRGWDREHSEIPGNAACARKYESSIIP